jgi:hypothetical protein
MRSIRALTLVLVFASAVAVTRPAHAESRTFATGSLVIPMDLAYQDRGMFQAYGLLFQLLRQGVPVAWVIEPTKTWHAAPCNTAADLCTWDCAIEGSGTKCAYPTASPDFFVGSTVFMSPTMTAGTAIANHGYRGGPFVIDAAHAGEAKTIITIWNTMSMWAANPWAQRSTGFQVVAVHETTAAFTGFVSRDLVAAPTIAVFSDGNEDIATSYLRAAGIKQSNGSEFPSARCGASNCGPGTANPDMLTVPSVAGDMGTCAAPNLNHKNGALFTPDGIPAYCQIMSMHWNVTDRETVQCNGGNCPATQAQCTGQTITYHGHEVVAEVRSFLAYPVHFFAECQAVNAYETTVPNPAWPYLDDAGREGHFLTTVGTPPACPCTEAGFSCVNNVCVPTDVREKGAGFLIANSPNPVKILHPEVPYNQMDGAFATEGGSEPAYNLSTYLGTTYKNDREVTFVTAPTGPGVQDVWMTGYSDGECDIAPPIGLQLHGPSCGGKVSYLGGHQYSATAPLTNNQGTRLFLNSLFEADCVSSVGQPVLSLTLTPTELRSMTVPAEGTFTAGFSNSSLGPALDGAMSMQVGAGVEIVSAAGGTINGDTISWTIGSISGSPGVAGDPPAFGSKPVQLRFTQYGTYTVNLSMTYRSGVSTLMATPVTATIVVAQGSPSDGDAGGADDDGGGGGQPSGCCQGGSATPPITLALFVVVALVRRRRTSMRD